MCYKGHQGAVGAPGPQGTRVKISEEYGVSMNAEFAMLCKEYLHNETGAAGFNGDTLNKSLLDCMREVLTRCKEYMLYSDGEAYVCIPNRHVSHWLSLMSENEENSIKKECDNTVIIEIDGNEIATSTVGAINIDVNNER